MCFWRNLFLYCCKLILVLQNMVAFDPDILQLLQMKYKVEDVTFYIKCTKENVRQMYDLVEVQGNCGVNCFWSLCLAVNCIGFV